MNPLDNIRAYYNDLTKTDMDIANYVLENPIEAARSSIDHLASKAHVSKSAVVRFSNRIGYSGYAELKYAMARYLTSQNTSSGSEKTDPLYAITENYSNYILQIVEYIDPEAVTRIADQLLNSNRIKIFGFNRTFNSALQLRQRLAKIGIDAEATSDTSLMDDFANQMHQEDCVVIFTVQDNTGCYRNIVNGLRDNHCPVLCFTMTQALSFKKKCSEYVVLPRISRDSAISFLDDQAIFFVFIEILIAVMAQKTQEK